MHPFHKPITMNIVLHMQQVLEDIDQTCHVIGLSLPEASDQRRLCQDYLDEQYGRDLLNRYLAANELEARSALRRYCPETIAKVNHADNDLKTIQTVEYELQMPRTLPPNAVEEIATGLHEYLVNRTIASWLITIGLPDQTGLYLQLSQQAMDKTHAALCERTRIIRRPYHWL